MNHQISATINQLLVDAQATGFEIDEDNETSMLLATRQHGNVADETPGQKDIAAAVRVRNLVRQRYPDLSVEIEPVDEWVHVTIQIP